METPKEIHQLNVTNIARVHVRDGFLAEETNN
jgi:hypothetical protein